MVVAVPHVLPCPVQRPPGGYRADASSSQEEEGDNFYRDDGKEAKEERRRRRRGGRKCPIPRGGAGGGLVEELRRWMGGTTGRGIVSEVAFEERLGGKR